MYTGFDNYTALYYVSAIVRLIFIPFLVSDYIGRTGTGLLQRKKNDTTQVHAQDYQKQKTKNKKKKNSYSITMTLALTPTILMLNWKKKITDVR